MEATRRAKAEDEGEFGYTARDPLFRDQHIIPGVVDGNLPQQGANPHPTAAPPVASPQSAPAGPTIGDLVEPFISEKTTRAKVSTKTQDDYRASLRLFMQVVGADRPVAAITDEEVVKFKELLLQCPTNFRKRLKTDNLEEAILESFGSVEGNIGLRTLGGLKRAGGTSPAEALRASRG